MPMNKVRLHIGGHQLRSDLEGDGLRQVYFAKACYELMNDMSPTCNPNIGIQPRLFKVGQVHSDPMTHIDDDD